MFSLRLDPREKRKFDMAAERDGYPSLTSWILDRCRAEGRMGPRHRRVAVGQLERIGAEVDAIARSDAAKDPDRLGHILQRIGTDIAALQRTVMDEDHVGQGDP